MTHMLEIFKRRQYGAEMGLEANQNATYDKYAYFLVKISSQLVQIEVNGKSRRDDKGYGDDDSP